MTIYNSFVFLDTYAQKTQNSKLKAQSGNILDKWVLARLNQTIQQTTDELDKYDVGAAAKSIESFVDDLSRWYIRRSRPRLQRPENKDDFAVASATLYHCLAELSKLTAPFTPFFADALYMSLVDSTKLHSDHGASSVHLASWPEADKKAIDHSLIEKMEEVRRISSLALALRAERSVKVRQPLQKLEVKSKKLDVRDVELLEILKDEVNVKEVRWNLGLEGEVALDFVVTPELKEEGLVRELVRMVQGLRHDANYVPKDRIALLIEAPAMMRLVWEKKLEPIKKDVGAKSVEFKKSDKFDAELNTKLDDQPIWVGVRKI
jgi:isoleucyl-tRNA synthetase